MSRLARQLLTFVLALGTVAAQSVCACPTPHAQARPVAQAAPAGNGCPGSGKCCTKQEASAPLPPSSESEKNAPCKNCNVVHPTDQIQPERQDAPKVVQQPFLALLPALVVHDTALADQPQNGRDHIPITPLLKDLFHSGILLLV
jgi:hypothetical protein